MHKKFYSGLGWFYVLWVAGTPGICTLSKRGVALTSPI